MFSVSMNKFCLNNKKSCLLNLFENEKFRTKRIETEKIKLHLLYIYVDLVSILRIGNEKNTTRK